MSSTGSLKVKWDRNRVTDNKDKSTAVVFCRWRRGLQASRSDRELGSPKSPNNIQSSWFLGIRQQDSGQRFWPTKNGQITLVTYKSNRKLGGFICIVEIPGTDTRKNLQVREGSLSIRDRGASTWGSFLHSHLEDCCCALKASVIYTSSRTVWGIKKNAIAQKNQIHSYIYFKQSILVQ